MSLAPLGFRPQPGWRRMAIAVALVVCASGAAAGELEIEWRAPDEPIIGFVIERRQGDEASASLIARVGPEARRFIDGHAALGSSVCYRVRAILGDGSWAPSLERCAAGALTAEPPEEVQSPLPPVSAAPGEDPPHRVSDRFSPVPARAFLPGAEVTLPADPRETTKP